MVDRHAGTSTSRTPSEGAAVVTSNRRILRHVTRSLAAAGWAVHACPFDRGLFTLDLERPRQLYLIDGDEPIDEVRWVLQSIHQHDPRAKALVLFHEQDAHALELLATCGLSNFIGRHGLPGLDQDLIDEEELVVTCEKLVGNEPFGLEKYLSCWGVELHERQVLTSGDLQAAIADIWAFLDAVDCYRGIAPTIALVAEELLNKALFNDPLEAAGDPEPDQPPGASAAEAVKLCFACDGWYIGVSVSDPRGSITADDVVGGIGRCHRHNRGHGTRSDFDSGLGLYMALNSTTQLVLNLAPGERTEIIALFYVRGGRRAFRASGHSFNVFTAGGATGAPRGYGPLPTSTVAGRSTDGSPSGPSRV